MSVVRFLYALGQKQKYEPRVKLGFDGPAKWKELHDRAKEKNGEDDSAWLAAYVDTIPVTKNGCDCKVHFKDLVRLNPPDWDNYYTWTVKMHNIVNKRLRKPIWSPPIEETVSDS